MAETVGKRILGFIANIPQGKVCTYAQLAKKFSTSPRAVGSIMRSNKDLVVVPCHRVVGSDGRLGGYSQGVAAKARLLKKEGVEFKDGIIDLNRHRWAL